MPDPPADESAPVADESVPAGEPAAGPPRRVRRERRERKSMLLRLEPELHDALARWAADDLRSTNAHVEWLLRRALLQSGRLGQDGAR